MTSLESNAVTRCDTLAGPFKKYIDDARPKNGPGKQIREPNMGANTENASDKADKRDTKKKEITDHANPEGNGPQRSKERGHTMHRCQRHQEATLRHQCAKQHTLAEAHFLRGWRDL